jgi:tetrahydromethanopterin S-methyltransferase subunit D
VNAKTLMSLAALAGAVLLATPSVADAAEAKLTGVVTKIDVAKDGKSAVATLKDGETAALVPITVTDIVTLQKFERSVIQVGDEVRCKYEKKGKKNVSTFFKKPAGCS